jgi:hypothetical protein
MKTMLFLLLLLVSAPTAFAQDVPVALDRPTPVTLDLVDASVEEAIEMVGKLAGIAIEWHADVRAEVRSQPAAIRIVFVNSPVDKALAFMTQQVGLSYVVVDPKTVRIVLPAR